MKILNFKKGTEVVANWPFWILYAIAVGVVGLIIVKTANVSIEEASGIPKELEDELILASRFYNSEKCFVYHDEVGRVHNKLIDESKFTQGNMDDCFPESDVEYAYSLLLRIPDLDEPPLYTSEFGPINTFNYITEGYAQKEIIEDVFVMHENIKYEGNLIIKIKNAE